MTTAAQPAIEVFPITGMAVRAIHVARKGTPKALFRSHMCPGGHFVTRTLRHRRSTLCTDGQWRAGHLHLPSTPTVAAKQAHELFGRTRGQRQRPSKSRGMRAIARAHSPEHRARPG